MNSPRLLVPLVVAATLGGGIGSVAVIAAGGGAAGPARTVLTSAPVAGGTQTAATVANPGLTAAQVYQQAKGSVAFITADVQSQGNGFFGGPAPASQVSGSGFVISKDGLIVTNDHVVAGGSNIKVTVGTSKPVSATLVGADPSTDVAVLKIDPTGRNLQPLQLGDSSKAQVGDGTYAIGSPFGLEESLTTGVVSALRRDIQAPDGSPIPGAIQTDAALNPGNSGGPLFNTSGQVIGINSQIATSGGPASGGNTGIGFAVPSNTVKRVVAQIIGHPLSTPTV
jgi:putative serine protease PepD